MKKVFGVLLTVMTIFTISACGNNEATTESTGPNYADAEFLEAFSTALEKRWDFVDSNQELGDKESLIEATNIEKEVLDDFKNRQFEDSKLQEKAISYINQLNEALELLNSFGADSFYENWNKYYAKRTQTILDFTENYDITFSDKYASTLSEMKAHGKEVQEAEDNRKALETLFQNVTFEYEPTEYDDEYKYYVAIIENNTGFNINFIDVTVNIIDSDEVVVDTQYIYVENWKSGQKHRLEFMTDKEVAKQDIQVGYYEIDR